MGEFRGILKGILAVRMHLRSAISTAKFTPPPHTHTVPFFVCNVCYLFSYWWGLPVGGGDWSTLHSLEVGLVLPAKVGSLLGQGAAPFCQAQDPPLCQGLDEATGGHRPLLRPCWLGAKMDLVTLDAEEAGICQRCPSARAEHLLPALSYDALGTQ